MKQNTFRDTPTQIKFKYCEICKRKSNTLQPGYIQYICTNQSACSHRSV